MKFVSKEKCFIGSIFIFLGILNIAGYINLKQTDIFCFSLASFFFTLASYFKKIKEQLYFMGLFCLFGLGLIVITSPNLMSFIRNIINENSMLLLTIGITFLNLFISERKELTIEQEIEKAKVMAKKEILEELPEKLFNK